MTFNVSYDVNPALQLLRDIRHSVEVVRDVVREDLKGPIRDHVQADVKSLIAPYPERDNEEFQFATPGSRIWYIIARRTGVFASQGLDYGPWSRTYNLEDSWNVEIDPRSTAVNTVLTITNTAVDELGRSYAKAVYGPDAVPGHAATGWGDNIPAAMDAVVDHIDLDLTEILQEALWGFRR